MNRPQLVKDMKKHLLPEFPLMVQPKKDGVRCMVDYDLSAWCRPRKKKPLVKHKAHIQRLIGTQLWTNLGVSVLSSKYKLKLPGPLDGELYIPGLPFGDVCSGVKGPDSEFAPYMQYHIFDLMLPNLAFCQRFAILDDWYNALPFKSKKAIKLVRAEFVRDMDNLEEAHSEYSLTDEGSIIRDPQALYAFDKSTRGAVRWKNKCDAEFLCVDITDGKGKDIGVAKFICELADGTRFGASSTGKLAERKRLYDERDKIIGKMITIEYQQLNTSGTPRFGHFKGARDYENQIAQKQSIKCKKHRTYRAIYKPKCNCESCWEMWRHKHAQSDN